MSDFFTKIVNLLANAHISSPRLEAREIMAFALNKNRSEIYSGCVIDDRQKAVVLNLVKKRIAHYPLDKLIGRKGFYKNEFITNENVLSPRPETEILVEKTLELKPKNAPTNILDLGTGSGCIIESILAERSLWRGVAVDISADALDVARKNAQLLEVDNRLRFIQASWFDDDFFAKISESFDLIVSNPPYIPRSDINMLDDEVKLYDPNPALDGGESGFDSYERIARITPQMLKNGGYILLEAGIGQAKQIAEIFEKQGLQCLEIVPDLSGIERCVILQKPVATL